MESFKYYQNLRIMKSASEISWTLWKIWMVRASDAWVIKNTTQTLSAFVHCAWAYNRGNITPKVLGFLWQYRFQVLTQLDPYLTLKMYGIPA